jgi:CMP-N-acetylneuraminic acid synthetase
VKAYAVIPARAGSKRVRGKNTRLVGATSLVQRAIEAARGADVMPWLSTASWDIVAHALGRQASDEEQHAATERPTVIGNLGVHMRAAQLASDHAQIESTIGHWLTRLDDKPDAIVLLQPTSPFRTAAHVREALRLLEATGADSVVGVTVGHEHHFAGRLKPREWLVADVLGRPQRGGTFMDWQPFRDPSSDRPRTQDLAPRGAENGSLYVTRRAAWEASGLRMSGHIVALPMTRLEGWDVDDESDLAACNALVAGGVCR